MYCPGHDCSGRTAFVTVAAGLARALVKIVRVHLTVARIAEASGASWHTANGSALAEGKRVLPDDPGRFGGVEASASTHRTGAETTVATSAPR